MATQSPRPDDTGDQKGPKPDKAGKAADPDTGQAETPDGGPPDSWPTIIEHPEDQNTG